MTDIKKRQVREGSIGNRNKCAKTTKIVIIFVSTIHNNDMR